MTWFTLWTFVGICIYYTIIQEVQIIGGVNYYHNH